LHPGSFGSETDYFMEAKYKKEANKKAMYK